MTPWPRAADIQVVDGLKGDFFKRHKKNRTRAQEAWDGLVARRAALRLDVQLGEPVPKRLRPKQFDGFHTICLIPELPHRFRALYEVSSASPLDPIIVTIVWIGDHEEYDTLFGNDTS